MKVYYETVDTWSGEGFIVIEFDNPTDLPVAYKILDQIRIDFQIFEPIYKEDNLVSLHHYDYWEFAKNIKFEILKLFQRYRN